MFRSTQEFVFNIEQDGKTLSFNAKLLFSSTKLNKFGELFSNEEIDKFKEMLNSKNFPVPAYWTLETLAEHMFRHASTVFPYLSGVTLVLTDLPQKTVDFIKDYDTINEVDIIDGDILELENID